MLDTSTITDGLHDPTHILSIQGLLAWRRAAHETAVAMGHPSIEYSLHKYVTAKPAKLSCHFETHVRIPGWPVFSCLVRSASESAARAQALERFRTNFIIARQLQDYRRKRAKAVAGAGLALASGVVAACAILPMGSNEPWAVQRIAPAKSEQMAFAPVTLPDIAP